MSVPCIVNYSVKQIFTLYSFLLFILAQMMEKKAKECKRWKQRAYKAERNLKLITNILTRSQLEELQRQNVVPLHEESLSQLDTSADSSLESRALAGVNDRRFTRVTEQLQVSSKN